VSVLGLRKWTGAQTCSWRFFPTPGSACFTSMPNSSVRPDRRCRTSCSTCGDWKVPVATITSRRAFTRCVPPPLHKFDAGRTAVLQHEAGYVRVGFDLQVRLIPDRIQERGRRRLTPAVPDRDLKHAEAFALAGIEIRDALFCRDSAASTKACIELVRLFEIFDVQRTAAVVILAVVVILVVDRLAEIRQQVVPAPARIAE
jgi:hypothetical protein